jgi:hypothetical protein
MENILAFPLYAQDQTDGHFSKEDGMTLLDYFAGQALQAILLRTDPGLTMHTAAVDSYEAAAAMLEAREKAIQNLNS